MTLKGCEKFARSVRLHILRMTHRSGSSHIGSGFSATDLLAVLYMKHLRYRTQEPDWCDRDRFVMSKGHSAAALYATLAESGFFHVEKLDTFCQDGTFLAGHVTHYNIPGVEVSTGSLGHGLGIASGMALAAQRENRNYRVFVMLSDGECDEGSTWEAALFSSHHKLHQLTAIIDYNKIQSLGYVKDVLDLEPFTDKWRAFGWRVMEIDGHNYHAIDQALESLSIERDRPSCIIAHTVKGKGVSFMENKLLWHYRSCNREEYGKALEELRVID